MTKEDVLRFASQCTFALTNALAIAVPVARAQDIPKPVPFIASTDTPSQTSKPLQKDQEEMAPAREFLSGPLQVGDATQNLLAWQRGGEIASNAPRPIAGNVANRSYERYLKSFEFPIPERMSSIVKSSSSSGSSGAK